MRRNTILTLLAGAMLLCAVAITQSLAARRHNPMHQLARSRPERTFAPRLSIPTKYHRCIPAAEQGEKASQDAKADSVQRETCATGGEGPLSSRELSAAGESPDPATLQAFALVTVIWWDDTEASLDAAISRLDKAFRLSPGSVPLLADLSAAHLVRAERTSNPQDQLRALNYAREALSRDPRNPAARFNAALALQSFGLDERATEAWDAYLAVDDTSVWADEARARKERLGKPPAALGVPGADASDAVVEAFATAHPQEARELGWDSVLGEWGAAVTAGDARRAARLLDHAGRLGRTLEQQRAGDASLADAVRAIRAAEPDAAATATLARAHRAYADARAEFIALDYAKARKSFNRVLAYQPSSHVLVQWATLFWETTRAGPATRDDAVRGLRILLAQTDSRYPALVGRTRLSLGTLLLRGGKYPDAHAHLERARAQLHHLGETELWGAALSTAGETAYEQGDTIDAYRLLHQATRVLRAYPGSQRLHNHLMALGKRLILDEMPHAALPIYDLSVRVAQRTGRPVNVFEAFQYRAHGRTIVADSLNAERDLESAVVWSRELEDEDPGKVWARAVLRLARQSTVSVAAMDSTVDNLSNNELWRIPALLWRADAMLAKKDEAAAVRDLESVTARIRGLSGQAGDIWLRAAMIEQARSRFDQLVMLHLSRDSITEALRVLERGRLSFAPPRDGTHPPRTGSLAPPRGHTVIEYALIGNMLLAWVLRPDAIHLLRSRVDRDAFLLAVEQVGAAQESGTRGREADNGLRHLYRWLIAPVRGHLGPPETPLVIVADGELAGIPFAALRDEERGRYLVEDHSLRLAATLADAARPAPAGPADSGSVLLVANPDFDLAEHPTLNRLPGALAEVDALAPLYSSRVLLKEGGATRQAFMTRAQTARLIHYAGHAVFDDARPERSYLVLAGADTTGRLTAQAVDSMQLRGAPLVVLSACRTLRARGGRSGGFAGFSGVLLAAGASGVVGSLWQADDQATQPLMRFFHQQYRELGDPARALRAAQVQMIQSRDSRLRSPAAWAGFRYMGS